MRSVVHKWFFIWQLDKESLWINDMADHGYGLVKGGRITFEFDDVEPGKYIYSSLFLKGNGYSAKNMEFYRFLEDMGITMINRINYPGTCCVYLRALKEDHPNGIEVYSDIDSKIAYESTLMWYLLFLVFFNVFAFLLNFNSGLRMAGGLSAINMFAAFCSLTLVIASSVYFFKLLVRIHRLRKERQIHE